MLRFICYALILIALISGGIWLQSHDGAISLQWQGYQVETTVGVAVAALGAALAACLFVLYMLIEIISIPEKLRRRYDRSGQEKGYIALNEAMLCLAINDRKHAERRLRKAQYYLGKEHAATQLCAVQLSYLKGDTQAVNHQLEHMTQHRDTKLLGLRGKAKAAMQEKQTDQAYIAAVEAWKYQQDDKELAELLLSLAIKRREWTVALDVVEKGKKHKYYSHAERRHLEAVVHYLRAKEAMAQEVPDRAQDRLKLALMRDPAFQPAQTLQGRLLFERGDKKVFFAWIYQVWAVRPISRYTQWFLELFAEESLSKLQKRVDKLVRQNPQHIESQLLLARMAKQRNEWDNARNHIKMALSHSASRRVYELMAEIEQSESANAEQASDWLKQAIRSPRDELWRCKACGAPHEAWQPHCRSCDAFDRLHWQEASLETTPGEPELLSGSHQSTAEAHPHSDSPLPAQAASPSPDRTAP